MKYLIIIPLTIVAAMWIFYDNIVNLYRKIFKDE